MMIRRMVFSRNRYFYGRLLTVSDFQTEQNYLRDKQQFRNLHTQGVGIVSGLSVKTQDAGRSLHISPGYAIDGLGRDICVPSAIESALPLECNRLLVSVGYAETKAEPTPTLTSAPLSSDNPVEEARIEEGFEVTLTPIPPGKRAGVRASCPHRTSPTQAFLSPCFSARGSGGRRALPSRHANEVCSNETQTRQEQVETDDEGQVEAARI